MKTKIEMWKKYKTKNGSPVTLMTTSGRSPWEVAGYIGDNVNLDEWTDCGRYFEDCDYHMDLVEVVEPVTIEQWVNVYSRGPSGHAYSSKAEADSNQGGGRIACVKLTGQYVPGDGL